MSNTSPKEIYWNEPCKFYVLRTAYPEMDVHITEAQMKALAEIFPALKKLGKVEFKR